MAHIGHPIVGDTIYGRSRQFEAESARHAKQIHDSSFEISIARPLLHAYKLGFTHPRTGKFMEFEAPVPEEMTAVLAER